jgi:nucleotide-binding universal stress UspA family protein
MIVLKHVLVATDFSPPSEAAVVSGRALARAFGASLTLLHVAENHFLRPMPADPHTITAATTRTLNDLLTDDDWQSLHARAAIEVADAPADAIVDYANTHAIDLIVMGTHGRSAVSQMFMGSVAERVVRTAPCPVLAVHHPEHEFVVPDLPDSEAPMIVLKTILVATDFSEPSDAALAYGRELARTFRAQLVVVHVAENLVTFGGADGFVALEPDLQRDLAAAAKRRLAALISAEDVEQLSARTVLLTSNTTAASITDYAKEANVDLIVIGTHGRGGIAHLLMGSVAERVVRTAPCPVLTVRHPEREFVLPDALVAVAKA